MQHNNEPARRLLSDNRALAFAISKMTRNGQLPSPAEIKQAAMAVREKVQ